MAAITWRELVGPTDTGAFRALGAAGETINTGFEALNKAVAQHQLANRAQYDRGQDAQAVGYREALNNAKDEDQVKAIQLRRDTMLAGLDPTRRAQLVGSEEARISSVRANTTAAQTFADQQAEFSGRDAIAKEYAKVVGSRDPVVAQAAIDAIPVGHPKRAAWIKDFTDAVNSNIKIKSDLDTAQSTRTYQDVTGKAATSNATSQKVIADNTVRRTDGEFMKDALAGATATATKLADANKGVSGSAEGRAALGTAVAAIAVDKAQLNKMSSLMSQVLASNPLYGQLPTAVVENAVIKPMKDVGTGFWNAFNPFTSWNSTVVAGIRTDLEAALKDPTVQQEMNRITAARGQLSTLVQQQRLIADQAQGKVFPELKAQLEKASADAQEAERAKLSIPASQAVSDATDLRRELLRGGVNNPAAPVRAATQVPLSEASPTISPNPGRAPTPQERQAQVQDYLAKKLSSESQATEDIKVKAAALLVNPDRKEAFKLQSSSAFSQLDKDTQLAIYNMVNGGGVKKAK